jgi:hypothetical protein
MVLVLMRVIGIGIETAEMLVKEILSRNFGTKKRCQAEQRNSDVPSQAQRAR